MLNSKKKAEKTEKNDKKSEKSERKSKQDLLLEEKNQQILDLTSSLQRLQAEFENYKKRTDADRTNLINTASRNMILKILPTLDQFELALKNKTTSEEFVNGIEMIYAGFIQTLEEAGVNIIKTVDEKFDPYLHEALLTEESDKEPGTIIEELQKGYKLHDKVIRNAKVKVSK